MTSPLCLLTAESLTQLAGALRSGRIAPPFTTLLLRRYVPESLASGVAAELQDRAAGGMEARHLAHCLDLVCQDRRQRPVAEDLIDLVWTGPEAPGIVNRDTSVVVREMFQAARESVLVAGYAVYQGQVVFQELAARMDEVPGLQVQMFLDVQRPPHDNSRQSELVRAFAERFVEQQWPGERIPKLYYDPRSLETRAHFQWRRKKTTNLAQNADSSVFRLLKTHHAWLNSKGRTTRSSNLNLGMVTSTCEHGHRMAGSFS